MVSRAKVIYLLASKKSYKTLETSFGENQTKMNQRLQNCKKSPKNNRSTLLKKLNRKLKLSFSLTIQRKKIVV
jgi:hypothetical protein